MVKYLGMVLAVAGSLMLADQAQAFGRHKGGCSSCGGCPGGNCSVGYADSGKQAYTNNAPPGVNPVAATTPAPATVTAAQPSTTTYAYNTGRRGLFGRR
jgi:hypothetical protein